MPQEVTYYCSFCDKCETVEAPTGFATHCGGDVENAACPDHAAAMEFLDDQCPGCVGGWGDCAMYTAIGNHAVTEGQIATIRAGRCPFRVNGTFSFGPGGFEKIDLSEKSAAGEAFARAITGN